MKPTTKDRKAAIAKARQSHHAKQVETKERCDAYVLPETAAGLQAIKAKYPEVNNKGQAIDKAVSIAMEALKHED